MVQNMGQSTMTPSRGVKCG